MLISFCSPHSCLKLSLDRRTYPCFRILYQKEPKQIALKHETTTHHAKMVENRIDMEFLDFQLLK